MKQNIQKFLKNPLISGSAILVIGTLFSHIFNFLFNLFMVQSLSVVEYGTLASIISIIVFPSLASAALFPLVIQFAGEYFAKGRLDMVRGFYIKITKFFFVSGLIIVTLFLIFISQIGAFFHIIDQSILWITAGIIFVFLIDTARCLV